MKRRGATLGLVLLVLSVSLVVVFSLASLTTVCLRTSAQAESEDHARNLAESAIYMGIDEICRNSAFGASVEVPVTGYPPDSSGLLTFSATRSAAAGMLTSFNNLGSKTARNSPEGRAVPGETVLLVGLGRCGAARVEVECLYYRPSFPMGLATGGAINATGLEMAGLMPGRDFSGDLATHSTADLRPVDLHSNNNLTLGPGCEVSGDVSAVGNIALDPATRVRGEVRPRIAPCTLPSLDLGQIRQALANNNVAALPVGGSTGSLSLKWYTEAPSDLTVSGDLSLDGALLYVPGSLTVTGRVTGRGAIMARGDVTLNSGSSNNPRDVLVVACDGRAKLSGQAGGRYFHGLVYCGSLEASDVTLVGSVVSRGATRLDRVVVVQTEVATSSVLGRPVRSSNNEDVFFWYVNRGEPDPQTLEPRYDYYMGIYIYAFTPSYNGSPNLQQSGRNKTRAEVTAEMLSFADSDFQPVDDVATGPVTRGSVLLAGPLANYLNFLDAAGPATVNFDLNRLLTPTRTARILYWGRVR